MLHYQSSSYFTCDTCGERVDTEDIVLISIYEASIKSLNFQHHKNCIDLTKLKALVCPMVCGSESEATEESC